jgi:hypothetical protein
MKQIYKSFGVGLFLLSTNLVASSLDSIGINVGVAHSNFHQTNQNGTIILGNEPDETFNSYEFYGTLKQELLNMNPTLSYTYSSNDDLKHQYLLVGLTKYYKLEKARLYAGLLGGYGELKYKYNPLNNSKENDYTANSLVGGIQAGLEYPISQTVAFNINTKVLYHNYDAKLNPNNTATAELSHNTTTLIGVGLGYKF